MKIYAVREAGTYKFHGIFWANTKAQLEAAVSDMAHPDFYEYAEIKQFGGIWHEVPNDETKPTSHGICDGDDHFMHPLTQTDEFLGIEILLNMDRQHWTRSPALDPVRF